MTLLPDLFERAHSRRQGLPVNAFCSAMHYTAKSMGLADTTNPKVHAKIARGGITARRGGSAPRPRSPPRALTSSAD